MGKKLVLKSIIFDLASIETNFFFSRFFQIFFVDVKKNRKKFVSKKWKTKLVLKSIIFDLASIETNFFLRFFFEIFSSTDVKKIEKKFVSKNGEKS